MLFSESEFCANCSARMAYMYHNDNHMLRGSLRGVPCALSRCVWSSGEVLVLHRIKKVLSCGSIVESAERECALCKVHCTLFNM